MVMGDSSDVLDFIRGINNLVPFNRRCGMEVISAEPGSVTLEMPWSGDSAQYSGFLHAGIIGALIETTCGFAAVTVAGRVLATHYSVNCLRPAVGERFVARAHVVKPGKTQVFTSCELYAVRQGSEKLVATGQALLVPVSSSEA
jgi:uncharacterized protein (TIGR00369 family)